MIKDESRPGLCALHHFSNQFPGAYDSSVSLSSKGSFPSIESNVPFVNPRCATSERSVRPYSIVRGPSRFNSGQGDMKMGSQRGLLRKEEHRSRVHSQFKKEKEPIDSPMHCDQIELQVSRRSSLDSTFPDGMLLACLLVYSLVFKS